MPRTIKMPRDPMEGIHHTNDTYIISSPKARYIWVYTDQGAGAIETQYADAQAVAIEKGVSRATAYRIMAKLPRFWLSDVRDTEGPKCYSVVKRSDLDRMTVYPIGNPNFHTGHTSRNLPAACGEKSVDKIAK